MDQGIRKKRHSLGSIVQAGARLEPQIARRTNTGGKKQRDKVKAVVRSPASAGRNWELGGRKAGCMKGRGRGEELRWVASEGEGKEEG